MVQLPEDVQRRVIGVVTLIRYLKWSLTAQSLNPAFFEFFTPHLEKPNTRLLETWLRSGSKGS